VRAVDAAVLEPQAIAIDELGEQLGGLRLSERASIDAVQMSLARHGQLSPIGVFVDSGALQVFDGFKRVRAARALGWSTLSALLAAVDAVEAKLRLATLHERGRGLCEIEEAWLVRSLYRDDKLSQPQIAARLGRHKSWVCRRLMLVESLDTELGAQVRLGLLAARAAIALAALPRGNQTAAAAVVIRRGLTLRQTERLVTEILQQPEEGRPGWIERRMDAGPPATSRPALRAPKTEGQAIGEDIETLRRVAARLHARLAATPLIALGAAAEIVGDALIGLVPVVRALSATLAKVIGEDKAA
jgi:ParB/RepB/Spo0J family partition protein